MNLTNEQIETLIDISQSAGKIILNYYSQVVVDTVYKKNNSPLTKADMAANDLICKRLEKLTPGIPIISEELALPEYEVRKKYKKYWLIDPLDGTKEFLKRNGEFTTNIALIVDNVPVAGFVYVPILDAMYWAVKGIGAYKSVKGETEKIHVREWNPKDEDVVVTCSRSHLSNDTLYYINHFINPDLLKAGSSLKMLFLAEGKADVYPRLDPIREWDVAAAHIILTEAGGNIYQYPSNNPVVYNKKSIVMPNFIAEGIRKVLNQQD